MDFSSFSVDFHNPTTRLVAFSIVGLILIARGVVFVNRARARRRERALLVQAERDFVYRDPWRRFTSALSAPYAAHEAKEVTGVYWRATLDRLYFGYGSAFNQATAYALVERDWGATSGQAVESLLTTRLRDARDDLAALPSSRHDVAFDVARLANLVRWSRAARLISDATAEKFSDHLGEIAVTAFRSWEDYGQCYIRGLAEFLGTDDDPYIEVTKWLVESPESPWLMQEWQVKAAIS